MGAITHWDPYWGSYGVAYLPINLMYQYDGGEPQVLWGLQTDAYGYAYLCAEGDPPPSLGLYTFIGVQNAWGAAGPRQGEELDEWLFGEYWFAIADQHIAFNANSDLDIVEDGLPNQYLDVAWFYGEWQGWDWIEAALLLDEYGHAQIPHNDLLAIVGAEPGWWIGFQTRLTGMESWFPWVFLEIPDLPPPDPYIERLTPNRGVPDTQIPVTITGAFLEGAELWTDWSGLTFSDLDATHTAITALFNIDASADIGQATVTVITADGETELFFNIVRAALSREYIYLNGRVLAIDRP
jgi:hypothetical protein